MLERGLLKKADLAGDVAYRKWMTIINCPDQVSGYREVRRPKMQAVRQQVDALLLQKPSEAMHVVEV